MSGGFGRVRRATILGTVPSAFAALSCGNPGDAAAGFVEANTIGVGGYARKGFIWAAVATPASGAEAVLLSGSDLSWTSTAAWPLSLVNAISHVCVWTHATSTSEVYFSGAMALDPSVEIDRTGRTISIPAGALRFTLGLQQ